MKATFTVEVPDEFVERRVQEVGEHYSGVREVQESAAAYFAGRCQDIAADDLSVAFRGWPVTVTVELVHE